jgi:putative ATP-grasp target RiPP
MQWTLKSGDRFARVAAGWGSSRKGDRRVGALFPSEDRWPTYPRRGGRLPPVPPGLCVRPWGVLQARPFPPAAAPPAGARPARVEVDAATQLAVYYDAAGSVIEAGKHRKTYEWREETKKTPPPGDSQHGEPVDDHVREQVEVD